MTKLQREAQQDDETKEISVSIMGMGVDEIAEILQ